MRKQEDERKENKYNTKSAILNPMQHKLEREKEEASQKNRKINIKGKQMRMKKNEVRKF